MNIDKRFTASLHTHVRSLFDADIDAKALCDRIKELGGSGCAITDHGVLTSIEDYRRVFADNDLKMIPGCELYVDGGILGRLHLVVLARNDHGYQGICKIVTQANRNKGEYPVITQDQLFEIMKDYKGEIFALSACLNGVISAIFLSNRTVQAKIDGLRKKSIISETHDDGTIENLDLKLIDAEISDSIVEADRLTKEIEILTEKRDAAKLWADKKYTQREKSINSLTGEEKEAALKALEKDKAISAKAVPALEEKKEQIKAAKKDLSEINKHIKLREKQREKLADIQKEIDKLTNDELKSDEDLYKTAVETAKAYLEVFGKGKFLAEIQYHGMPEEQICYPQVVKVANELGLPLVATNDVHILNKTDDERLKRMILRSMRFKTAFEEENIGDSELYLKDNYELFDALKQIVSEDDAVRAINNINVVFDACNVEFKTGKHYPVVKLER